MNPVTGTGWTSVAISVNANLELVGKFCYLGWMELIQAVGTSKHISLIVIGRLYSSCV